MKTSRRAFLHTTLAGSFAATAFAGQRDAYGDKTNDFPIIDTHQHLWDLSKFKLPWHASAPEAFRRSFVTKDYLEATRGLNVKAVYMEVNVDPGQQVAEAEHVISLCKSDIHPTIAAVISGRPSSASFAPYINRYKNSPYVKGVRRVLHDPDVKRGTCLEDTFVKNMHLLGDMGLSFDLCMRPSELMDGVKLADRCPGTRFIIDHCGNADPKAFGTEGKQKIDEAWHQAEPWKKSMAEFAKRKNVICKISGIVVRAPRGNWTPKHLAPIINHCLDEFGPDRVIFGSDWPVCILNAKLRDWVAALKEVTNSRGPHFQRKFFHDNAVKFYGLA